MLRRSVSKLGGQAHSAARAPNDSIRDRPRMRRGKWQTAAIMVGRPSARGGRRRWGGGRQTSRAGRNVTLRKQLSPIPTTASQPRSCRKRWRAAPKATKHAIVVRAASHRPPPVSAMARRRRGSPGLATPMLVEGPLQDVDRIVHTKTDQARDAAEGQGVERRAQHRKDAKRQGETEDGR